MYQLYSFDSGLRRTVHSIATIYVRTSLRAVVGAIAIASEHVWCGRRVQERAYQDAVSELSTGDVSRKVVKVDATR